MRLSVDKHTWAALLFGKADRIVRLGSEPRPGPVPVFKTGHRQSCGRLIVRQVTPSTLDELMPDGDVKAALLHGAPTTVEFRRRWLAQHDRAVKRMTADQIAGMPDDEVTDRWRDWRPVRVWSLLVELDRRDRERFLSSRPQSDRARLTDNAGFRLQSAGGGDAARGYTNLPALGLSGEGAAVDDVTLERFAVEAQDRDAARRRERLYEVERQLLAAAVDADARDLKVIRDRLQAMARRAA